MASSDWQNQRWVPFLVAVVGVLVVACVRLALHPWAGEAAGFSMFGIPVAAAALIGGFWPGFTASVLGFFVTLALFRPPKGALISAPSDAVVIGGVVLSWMFVCLICDVSLRQRRAEFLAQRQRDVIAYELSQVLDRLTDSFFLIDKLGVITQANSAAAALAMRSVAHIVDQPLWEVFGDDEANVRRHVGGALQSGTPAVLELRGRHDRWLQMRVFPDPDGALAAVFVQDVTVRRQLDAAKEQLLESERAARTAAEGESKSKDDFVAVLSHELRTPLTAVIGWVEVLKSQFDESPELSEGLRAIERSAKQQARLIEDLLDMSRIVTGQMTFQWEVVDLREIVEEAIREQSPTVTELERTIVFESGDEEVLMRGDAVRLGQVVTNLIANAVKFTDTGGTIAIRIVREEGVAFLEVKDDGQGIAPELIGVIFERFRQANVVRGRGGGGLGLGLAIVRQLVEAHDGSVAVNSGGIGQGASFTVMLPTIDPHQVPVFTSEEVAPVDLAGLKVLLVEDDLATGQMLERVLASRGVQPLLCPNALTGLEMLASFAPDVLVSDIGLPDIDGKELIRRIRDGETTHLPALAISAFASPVDRDEALNAGFDAYLAKPIQIERLISSLAEVSATKETKSEADTPHEVR